MRAVPAIATARAGDRGRVPRAAAVARADGARVRGAAGGRRRRRARAGARGGHGGVDPGSPSWSVRRAAGALPARRGGHRRRRARSRRAAVHSAWGAARWSASCGTRSGSSCSRGCSRVAGLGAGDADDGRVRPAAARAAVAAGGARSRRFAARHRRGRRGRRARAGARPDAARDRGVDARLPERGVLRRHGYTAERGCGRAALCPALSLPDLFRHAGRVGDARAGARAARRGPGVLLARSDHAGRPHGRCSPSASGWIRWRTSAR